MYLNVLNVKSLDSRYLGRKIKTLFCNKKKSENTKKVERRKYTQIFGEIYKIITKSKKKKIKTII